MVRREVFDVDNFALVVHGDAAFASKEFVKSQAGEILLATKPEHVNGAYDLAVVLSFRSSTIKRIVRSTIASEGYAVTEAAELTEWTRHVLAEMLLPSGEQLHEVEGRAEAMRRRCIPIHMGCATRWPEIRTRRTTGSCTLLSPCYASLFLSVVFG